MKLFARRRTATVRPPIPTPADLHTDSLRRFEAAVTPALTVPEPITTATHAERLPIVPVRGSYTVTYQLRGHSPDPITTSDVKVIVDLGKMRGLVRVHGLSIGSFDLTRVGGAR